MTINTELHPMIGMNLKEQEEWFNSRIKGIFDIDPPLDNPLTKYPHGYGRDLNVIPFKPHNTK